jgi:AP-2 complex subunit alpha
MVECPHPVATESVLGMLRAASFGVEHGYLDPSPHNEAGAAHFVWGAPEQSVLVQVGTPRPVWLGSLS